MNLKHFLSGCSLLTLLAMPALAAEPLQPRAEISFKGGTDRSLLTTEFWTPLAQENDRVLYGDFRLMGDNDENREGNLGIGYRQIKNNAVIGGHAWIDRRRTQHNSTFHQLTVGAERLGHVVDIRANTYVPINNGRTVTTPNIGSSNPYLAGSGIFYDTNGFVTEIPQYGLDGEIGYRIPVLEKKVDSIRAYGGGYHFFRDKTQNVTGFRIRTEAQINKAVNVGARFQYDHLRGSQGFLEVTLKFPFSAKKLYQTDSLRARLDESPERDVDIVTDTKIDNGKMKPIINTTTGTKQRILHVNNTNTNSGDGTYENPFNTLNAAQTALQAHDIVYINRGDGTTTGMDQGIVVNQSNISLIGSGSALNYNGYTILQATLAPVITNTIATVDNYTGHGVLVMAENAFISGITVDGATFNGIRVYADGVNLNSFTVENVTAINNKSTGIAVQAQNLGRFETINLLNNTSSNNLTVGSTAANGIAVNIAATGGSIGTITMSGNTANGNAGNGFGASTSNGIIERFTIQNNTSTYNGRNALSINSSGSASLIDNINITNLMATNNGEYGIYIRSNSGKIQNVQITDSTTNNNTLSGINLNTITSTSLISNINLSNITANDNTSNGIEFATQSASSQIKDITLSDIRANNNGIRGMYFNTAGGIISNMAISNATTTNNGTHGLIIHVNTGRINDINISNLKTSGNSQYGLYFYTQSASSVIDAISVSNSDITNNAVYGVYVRRSSNSATLNVDLGNGAFGSVGQNRIFGNTTNDMHIDRSTVNAGSNWWNNGGLAPSRVSFNAGGSATYPTPLATDPRP